jgi:transcription elongation factor Elf1
LEKGKENVANPNQPQIFKCKDCGYSTDSVEDFITHKIASYNQWLQEQLNKKLEQELCPDGICKKLESKGFRLIKKEEWDKLNEKREEKQPERDEWKPY